MAKPDHIQLCTGLKIPILYEDHAVLAIDKPRGWLLAPSDWRHTGRNLQRALESSVAAGDFWARSRNIRFLRFVHRLDADTSGVLLLVKNIGAVKAYGALFESHQVEKTYWAVSGKTPRNAEWTCQRKLSPHPEKVGLMIVDDKRGKPAETVFRVLCQRPHGALIEARPMTGRTHQIRLHLALSNCPVLHDSLYGHTAQLDAGFLALRATSLIYTDPFRKNQIRIRAPIREFLAEFGFSDYQPPKKAKTETQQAQQSQQPASSEVLRRP